MKKTIIFLGILLFSISLVLAEEIDIKIIQYDMETNLARIQIANLGSNVYNNVSLAIDNNPYIFIVSRMAPNSAAVKALVVDPGKHTITISTKQQKFLKDAWFAKSSSVIEQEKKEQEIKQQVLIPTDRKKPLLSKTAWQTIFLLGLLGFVIFIAYAIKVYVVPKKTVQPPVARYTQRPGMRPIQRRPIRRPIRRRPLSRSRSNVLKRLDNIRNR